jgi:hypothetical protein
MIRNQEGVPKMSLEKIKIKIAAILSKKTENGATEAEAMSAMEMAARMMKEHGVTLADIQVQRDNSSDFVRKCANENAKNLHPVDSMVAVAIAEYTDTKVWNDRSEYRNSNLTFFGYAVDVELAIYIREVCKNAMDSEWNKFKRSIPAGIHKSTQRKSFMYGMANRLVKRLRELKDAAKKSNEGANQLVVVKKAMVEREFAKTAMRLSSNKSSRFSVNPNSYQAGQMAGDNVRFNRAVYSGPTGGQKMIAAG